MRALGFIGIYFVVVFLAGALLAPWVYTAVQGMAKNWSALQEIADEPFRRYVNRCLLLFALLGLRPLFRMLGGMPWKTAGIAWRSDSKRLAILGFGVGFGSLAVAACVTVLFGGHAWDESRSMESIIDKLISASVSGVVVGILEEVLFRAGIFGALKRGMNFLPAAAWSSAIYAIVHYFSRPETPESVEWFTGILILIEMCEGFFEWQRIIPGFLNLWLVGMSLALVFHKSRSIWGAVGMHAGWVFWVKAFGHVFKDIPERSAWFWGGRTLIDGWLVCGILSITLYSLFRYWRSSPEETTKDG